MKADVMIKLFALLIIIGWLEWFIVDGLPWLIARLP